MVLRAAALAGILILLITGCADGGDEPDPAAESAPPTLEELGELVGCEAYEELTLAVLPGVQRRVASDARRCFVGDDMVDLYERAPVEANGGGSIQSIDMLLSTGTVEEGCEGWVLTGETWFIFSTSEQLLDQAADDLDTVVRPVVPAMPSYSYGVPSDQGGLACGI